MYSHLVLTVFCLATPTTNKDAENTERKAEVLEEHPILNQKVDQLLIITIFFVYFNAEILTDNKAFQC
jgi:hypothetical protein